MLRAVIGHSNCPWYDLTCAELGHVLAQHDHTSYP
jgi:hypothetical protein